MTETADTRRGELSALVLLCAGMLLYELILMRIFSVLMWYHFASLSIGIALLGLGAGGLAVGLRPSLGLAARRSRFTLFFAFGAVLVLLCLVALHGWPELSRQLLAPFHQPFYRPFERPDAASLDVELAVRLGVLSLGVGWPFFFVGAVTAGVLREHSPDIKIHYAATFLGSAGGCALFPLLLTATSAPAALGVAGALAAVAAALWGPSRISRAIAVTCALGFVLLGAWAEATGSAEVPFARGRFEPDILAVRWNAMSRVAAFPLPPDEVLRPYGQSIKYRGGQPRQIGLVVDDSGYTNLYSGAESADNPEYFRANLVAVPFHLRPGARALLFGPGGGKDVWIALSFPGVTVQAVEINPQVIEMVEQIFAAFTGKPYSQSRVKLEVADARKFARQDSGVYDIIGASAVFGRLPPSAGAFTLSEDLLHTAEAFEDYWDRLSDNGILSVTRFAYEQRALRLTALARELLDRKGLADPGRHIRVVSDRGLANVMVSKKPFSEEDDRQLKEVLDRYGFEFLYPHPGAGSSQLSRLVDDRDFKKAIAGIDFDVSPPTDDRPFFYYTVRPRDFLQGSIPGRAGFDDRGAEILRLSFLIMMVLSLAALVLPVLFLRGLPRSGKRASLALCYFFAIGFGYMILEIGTMKRLLLVLGHPVHAVTVTLLAFLLGSGAGCLLSGRLAPTRRKLAIWLAVLVALGLVQSHVAPLVLAPVITSHSALRFLAALLVTLPLAFVMGIPFPAAAACLGRSAVGLLPWIWSVNGFASVSASLGALLLAMNFGYTNTLDIGAACYLAALLCLWGFGSYTAECEAA